MIDSKSCYPRRKEGIVSRTMGDEVMLYDPETRKVHVLNKTSLLIWNFCTGELNLEMMEREFRGRFSVAEGQDVTKDIRESIVAFESEGLVRILPSGI